MSELKAFESERIYWAVEQVERVVGDIDDLHLDDNLFYIKSEADNVIAEKDKEIEELKKQVHDYAQGLYVIQARAEKELRYHKYRRCLAMYYYCAIKALYEMDLKENYVEWKWYSKWMHKWFKLAEKFKEAK